MTRSQIRLVALLVLMMSIGSSVRADAQENRDANDCGLASSCNVIHGFGRNQALPNVTGATISGGGEPTLANQVLDDFGTVGGGVDNKAGNYAAVAGGSHNSAIGFRSIVGGGSSNTASSANATVAGGMNNVASFVQATVSGGSDNTASALDATVGGGSGNIASFTLATVAGGSYNTANSIDSTVGGGDHNTAGGAYSTVGGGSGNSASGFDTAVGGGSGNKARGENANIAGGLANLATGKYSAVAGGYENLAGTATDDAVQYAAVGGGSHNTASGFYSTVPGGSFNTAASAYSLAAGRRANVQSGHDGAFLFADSNDSDFDSAAANEFAVRATGGVRFVTAVDAEGNPHAGVRLAPGGGSWESLSDRNAKTDLSPVDGRQVLERLVAVPINTWRYKTQDSSIRHIGPTAQDWSVFAVGEDDKYINTMDANGIALAAIQGLYQEAQDKDTQIAALKAENVALEKRVTALEQHTALNSAPVQPVASSPLYEPLALIGACLAGLALGQRQPSLLTRWPWQGANHQ
jgi:hypothetical protein